MTDVFRECRERVSAQDAARHYGLTFDRKDWADTLADGTPEEQAQIYKERGQIARWIEKVLSS